MKNKTGKDTEMGKKGKGIGFNVTGVPAVKEKQIPKRRKEGKGKKIRKI